MKNDENRSTQDQVTESTVAATNPSRRRAFKYSLATVITGVALAAASALTPRPAYALFGRCYKCNCCGFQGNQNTCGNCGHSYDNHSGQPC